MWCVVGGDQVDCAVFEPLNDLLAVFFGAERRIHLGKCAVLKKCFLCKCVVMRGCLCVDVSTEFFCCTDKFNGVCGADMLDYDSSTASKGKHTVTGNHHFLGDRR